LERQTALALSSAIRTCLEQCRQSEAPLTVIAETVERLRAADWHEADVLRVEAVVRKVLVGVLVVDEHDETFFD
jgi:hypothetical protein